MGDRRRGSDVDRLQDGIADVLKQPLAGTETAALAAIAAVFDLPALEREVSLKHATFISLDYGERLWSSCSEDREGR